MFLSAIDCRFFAAAACLGLALLAGGSIQANERTVWLTGAALQRKLDSRETIAWSGSPLRDALGELSRIHQFALLIDCRVDPNQPLELSRQNVPLADLLADVATNRDMAVSQLGPVVYFGPPQAARRLRTVAELSKEQLARLSPPLRSQWTTPRAWRWSDLATPRELLEQLAREARLEIQNLEAIPHDLWAAGDLPPLSLADRLTLILVQFDKSFEVVNAQGDIRLVAIPDAVSIERTYPAGGQPQQTVERIKQTLPDADVRLDGTKIAVRALLEDHERLENSARPTRSSPPAPPKNLDSVEITLTVKSIPLKDVLNKLAEQLDLEFHVKADKLRAAGRSLTDRVSFEAKGTKLDATLRLALEPVGLTFRRTGREIEILPAE